MGGGCRAFSRSKAPRCPQAYLARPQGGRGLHCLTSQVPPQWPGCPVRSAFPGPQGPESGAPCYSASPGQRAICASSLLCSDGGSSSSYRVSHGPRLLYPSVAPAPSQTLLQGAWKPLLCGLGPLAPTPQPCLNCLPCSLESTPPLSEDGTPHGEPGGGAACPLLGVGF